VCDGALDRTNFRDAGRVSARPYSRSAPRKPSRAAPKEKRLRRPRASDQQTFRRAASSSRANVARRDAIISVCCDDCLPDLRVVCDR
jgi:hypothetical protein